MSRSFHRWRPGDRIETALDEPLRNVPTGFFYSVVEDGGRLFQVEYLLGPDGKRLHELRRRVDYVMGSGHVARTYFTELNGRLFQLPLTWYRDHGWDFSPGYELNNARFDRLLPDRCIACHGSYPRPIPFLEGKFAALPDGIGCERCHGPGTLHVEERRAGVRPDSAYDNTIVNPARLPLERRLDVCEQCHVHTPVTVLREGRHAFDYRPSQPLSEHAAFFKVSGSIDVVSHADRLRQSACFIGSRVAPRPLECATCHDPHRPPPDSAARSGPCRTCHPSQTLAQRLKSSPHFSAHTTAADCVGCHMPRVRERAVPHGSFTEHWIRVVPPRAGRARASRAPIEAYYERDRAGPEAALYQGMGRVVYATLAGDSRALGHAAAALRRDLGGDTTRGEAHFLLGLAYRQLGRSDAAIRALERSVRGDSSRPDRLHALARAYEGAGGAPAVIERLYRRALELQPALAWIRADFGRFLQAQGRTGDAETAYRDALAEQPNLAVAWFNLGTLLAAAGRIAEASAPFREAVSLDPTLAEALSPLVLIRTAGSVIGDARVLGFPLAPLPVRDRGPQAVRFTIAPLAAGARLRFTNVPPRGLVQVLDPDGTVVRSLRGGDAAVLDWDLLTEAGEPVPGGLYRARVQGRDASGHPLAPQVFYVGVVRQRVQ